MKKLLIITDMYPNKYNPVSEVFVKHQVDELAKRYEVRVIATIFSHKYSIEQNNVTDVKMTFVYYPLIRNFYLTSLLFYRLYAIPEIKRVILSWKPDLIHVHDCRHVPELILLHSCLNSFSIPRYLTVHNIRTHPSMIKSSRFKWLYRMCFNKSYSGWKHIFTVNDRLKDFILKQVRAAKITNVGNAIGPLPQIDSGLLDKYKTLLDGQSFKIIAVGNLKAEKGFDLLINSVHNLIVKNRKIQVIIIGSGVEEFNLARQINKLDLQGSIILTGGIDNDIVRNLYPLFDAFVLASYSETFGIVYLEAMFAGIPVIGVIGQGIDGIIQPGINGWLVKPRDTEDLTEKIESIMNNRDTAQALAINGQNLVKESYQLSSLIDRITKIYEQ